MARIEARGLRKVYGKTLQLERVNLRGEEGRILRLMRPHRHRKSTPHRATPALPPFRAPGVWPQGTA